MVSVTLEQNSILTMSCLPNSATSVDFSVSFLSRHVNLLSFCCICQVFSCQQIFGHVVFLAWKALCPLESHLFSRFQFNVTLLERISLIICFKVLFFHSAYHCFIIVGVSSIHLNYLMIRSIGVGKMCVLFAPELLKPGA